MIDKQKSISSILGLDIGRINTRGLLFAVTGGKYRLAAFDSSTTSMGYGLKLTTRACELIRSLGGKINRSVPKVEAESTFQLNGLGEGLDKLALVSSAGPRLRTGLLGLTTKGSLAAGRALIDSLPLDLICAFGLPALANEIGVIDALAQAKLDILIITGGEDTGTVDPVRRWVEIVRLACLLLPDAIRPLVVFAGNPKLESSLRRRIEPITTLHLLPNLQPAFGELDLIPTQEVLDGEIIRNWKRSVTGMDDLLAMSNNLARTNSFALGRMVRYLGRAKKGAVDLSTKSGVLGVDLGGGSTSLSAGLNGQAGVVTLPSPVGEISQEDYDRVHLWTSTPVTMEEVSQYLSNQSLHPTIVPENEKEMALTTAFARVRFQNVASQFSKHYPWFGYQTGKGLMSYYEPVIASGAVLTQAPTRGQALLTLLDGLQPWGITTMVLDKHHILPLLGVIGEMEPVLPVQVLESEAFENLGTVVTAVSGVLEGEIILRIKVTTDAGKDYEVDVEQGTLKRLVIPPGVSAELELEPRGQTDVGFGERGKGGRLKVVGGALGIVIDARGRPVKLPIDDEVRVAKLQSWLLILAG